MPRVLVSQFGAITRLGLHALLEEEGCEVIEPENGPSQLLLHVDSDRPDVVILNMDSGEDQDLARRIVLGFPAVRVIVCSAERPTMRVYLPFGSGESYESDLSSALLTEAVRG